MDTKPDQSLDELRACLTGLSTFVSLAAESPGTSTAVYVGRTLDALAGMLSVSFVFAHRRGSAETAIDCLHLEAGLADGSRAAEDVRGAIASVVEGDLTAATPVTIRGVPFSIAGARLAGHGVLVAGSRRGDFPTATECLTLHLAATQLSTRLLEREVAMPSEALMDSIPGLVALLDTHGHVLFVNRRIVAYTGRTLSELQQWGTNDTVHPEDLPRVIEAFSAAIGSGTPYEIEQRLRQDDGTYRWFQNNGFPVRDAGGRILHWCVLLTDIDERVRSAQALRWSGRDLKLIVDTIPALAWSARPDGSAEFFNQHYLDFVGRSEAEMSGWGWTAAVHPEDLPGLAAQWQRIMASKAAGEAEARLRRSDGDYRWFLLRANPLRDEAGRIVRWYGVNTDIEDRRRAEDALRTSERNLLLLIDTIPALAWSARPDGSAEFLNQHYLDFIGLSADQVRNWNWAQAVHPDDLAGLMASWQRQVGSEAPGAAEARLRRHDGEYRWFIFRANPVRDDSGKIVRWYGVNTDIEDRKRAEDALRRSEHFLLEVQRLSHTGGWRFDVAAGTVESSAEIRRGYDVQPHEDASRTPFWFDRIHPDDRQRIEVEFERCLRERTPYRAAYRIVRPDGGVRYQHVAGHPVFGDTGDLVEFVGAAMDMTEHWLAAQELQRASEALRSLQDRMSRAAQVATAGELAASIAHEVNQPLAGIVTNANTCLRMLAGEPPNVEGARETVKRALRDGTRAADVIARLRALFTNQGLALEPLDLNEVAREVVTLSASDLQKNQVAVRLQLVDALPKVDGDRIQIQQVILNLIRNASDAMAGVHDRPRQLLVQTGRDDKAWVCVSVRDVGEGLDPRRVDKLFDPFFTTKPDGMGVGLSISRSIVERHHGRLWAEPNDGHGATFSFSLPCGAAHTPVGV